MAIGLLVAGAFFALAGILLTMRRAERAAGRRRRAVDVAGPGDVGTSAQSGETDLAGSVRQEALSILQEPLKQDGLWTGVGAASPPRQFRLGSLVGFGVGLICAGLITSIPNDWLSGLGAALALPGSGVSAAGPAQPADAAGSVAAGQQGTAPGGQAAGGQAAGGQDAGSGQTGAPASGVAGAAGAAAGSGAGAGAQPSGGTTGSQPASGASSGGATSAGTGAVGGSSGTAGTGSGGKPATAGSTGNSGSTVGGGQSVVTPGQPVVFTIPPGEPAVSLADRLVAAGIVASRQEFLARVTARKADVLLQAGEFRLRQGMAPDAVIDILAPTA